MLSVRNTGWLLSVVFLNGCASVALNAGFDQVQATVEERAAINIYWNNGTDLDKEAAAKLASLLKDKLTVDDAVQVALLNNRELQAVYSDLGIAQADLVQAGLLNNPIFDGAIKWATAGGGKPDLELAVVMNFLDIIYLPLRKRVATARFEEAKTRVSGMVLDFAARVRTAFFSHQANEQMLDLRRTIVQALTASFGVTRRLHEAGNITDLDLGTEFEPLIDRARDLAANVKDAPVVHAGKAIALALGIGAGAAGAGAGIGNIFGSMIQSVARQPELRGELQGLMWLGFALTEAVVFYGFLGGLLGYVLV